MANLTKQQLLQKIVSAAALSGWSVANDGPADHPFRLLLSKDDTSEKVLVYIWNITSGGNNRPADEYRIQVTGVTTIDQPIGFRTLLLGYWQHNNVFAGWDASRHSGLVTGSSPSLQIREDYLLKAHSDGLSVCPRSNDEVAVAFSPLSFINYVRNLNELHGAVTLAEQVVVAHIAETEGQINEAEISSLPVERQTIIRQIAERQRASDFRERVLEAYKSSCAVCGLQLKLVDAAHIVPVKHSDSNDETSNGLCLCALHHRAFDQGLIAILPDYYIVINRTRLALLQSQSLSAGEESFIGNLQIKIDLPRDRAKRPNALLIAAALRVRGLGQDSLERTPRKTETEQL